MRRFISSILLLATLVIPGALSSAATCSTTGAQNTLVLLVTFPGGTLPTGVTTQSIQGIFFGSTGPSLDGYWREASYGVAYAAGDVREYNLSSSYTCFTLPQMQNDAIAAAYADGVNIPSYTHVVVVFPDVLSCGWVGMSSVGCTTLSYPAGTFPASYTFINSDFLVTSTDSIHFTTHELGHALGLNHGRARTFTSPVEPLGPLGTLGTTSGPDHFSTMGDYDLGHYSAPHKAEELGWLTSPSNYQTVTTSGTYVLAPFETSPAGLKALKVQRGTGNNAWLWLEYRQPVGAYDSELGSMSTSPPSSQVYTGALIHYEDSLTPSLWTDLLNFQAPTDTSLMSVALAAGQTWTDPYTNLSLSVLSATSTGLTVSVNYGAVPCGSAAPSVSISPSDPSIYPGQTASYTVSVTDNDSSGCSSSTINLSSSQPSGWSTSLSAASVTLSPGQSGTVTMGKGAPSSTAPGTYAVNLNAATSTHTGSTTANATVMAAPSLAVSVAVSGSTFTSNQKVSITASVLSGGVAAAGASVTFTMTKANGSKITQTVTASSTGKATWTYKIGQKDPKGTWSAVAQATYNSHTVTSNTATFTVQ
jgi:M6 family metalloprotease-like protein